jgi:hypothetical protein
MVETRLSLLPKLPNMVRQYKYESVSTTTVEEYEILLMIGKALGAQGMPELKIPEKIILPFPNRYKPWYQGKRIKMVKYQMEQNKN